MSIVKQFTVVIEVIIHQSLRFWNCYVASLLSVPNIFTLAIFSIPFAYISLRCDNLGLDLHGVPIFWLESDTWATLSSCFAWRCLELELVVPLMLENFFPSPVLCNMKQINLYYIQNMKINSRYLVSFRASNFFLLEKWSRVSWAVRLISR